MPNTDWERLDDKQLERTAGYMLMAEFSSHGFDVMSSAEEAAGGFALQAGKRRFGVRVKSLRSFKTVSFPKEGTDLAVLAVFLEGKAPMTYMLPSEAWNKPDALLRTKGDKLILDLSKKSMNLLANYGLDFAVRRLAKGL